jgi:hypothetical protein
MDKPAYRAWAIDQGRVHRYMIIPESLDEMLTPVASENPLDHIPNSFLDDQDYKTVQKLKNKIKAGSYHEVNQIESKA